MINTLDTICRRSTIDLNYKSQTAWSEFIAYRIWRLKMKDGMVIKGDWSSFIDLEREELLLVTRKHLLKVITPIFYTWTIISIFGFAGIFLFTQVIVSLPLLIVSSLLMLGIGIKTKSNETRYSSDRWFTILCLDSKSACLGTSGYFSVWKRCSATICFGNPRYARCSFWQASVGTSSV